MATQLEARITTDVECVVRVPYASVWAVITRAPSGAWITQTYCGLGDAPFPERATLRDSLEAIGKWGHDTVTLIEC